MKNRLASRLEIERLINSLVKTVDDTKKSVKHNGNDYYYWDLFYNAFDFDGNANFQENQYDSGAISLAIVALCNNSNRKAYQETINKSRNLLLYLRNEDGSWPSLYDYKQSNTGVIYNTYVALDALIDSGYLNHDDGNNYKADLSDNVKTIMESIRWLYNERIVENDGINGWGYTGNSKKQVFIMPTVSVLLIIKKIAYKILKNQPNCILGNEKQLTLVDGKTLFDLIDEIQKSIYTIKNVDGTWGKTVNSEGKPIYTLHGLYSLVYLEKEFSELHEFKDGTIKFSFSVPQGEIKVYEKLIKKWTSVKYFSPKHLDNLMPEDFFDSYIQSSSENGKVINNIIDHETFFEPLAIKAITYFIIQNKMKMSKLSYYAFYKSIASNVDSLITRITSVDEHNHIGVKSRRGLLSQIYPIYSIAQTIEAFCIVEDNFKFIKGLRHYNKIFKEVLAFIIQFATIFTTNFLLVNGVLWWRIVIASSIAIISDVARRIILYYVNKDDDDE